ncbi:MAG: bacillithiol biosynthesis BshC [Gemmatimonadaceae bacterium]|nr:bacillithiol biosynthesis BshC [Gemmatimonadaceae bacterium]
MSMTPVVERVPLGLGPLAAAVRAGTLPAGNLELIPRDLRSWQEQIELAREPMMGLRWADTLREALRPAGAAAARLARVSGGQGVVVTTGQQPGLFGGPMYTIIKALSALALADRIEAVTGVPTAPIFWAATDDADFAEGARTWLPVGGALQDAVIEGAPREGTMMSHAFLGDMAVPAALLRRAAAGAAWPEYIRAACAAYQEGTTVGNAFVELMREILMPLGITVLNAAHPSVRHQSAPLLRRALAEASVIDAALRERTAVLRGAGFTPQVELLPDRSLVFVVRNGVKERASVSGAAAVLPRVSDDLLSPNVLLRPIVERALLPTVAYMAGPGEMAYFAQVSAVAEALRVASPLALPRTSLRVVTPEVQATLVAHGQSPEAMRDTRALVHTLAADATPDAAMDALTSLRAQIHRTISALRTAGTTLPPAALDGAVAQFTHRADRLERRVLAATKRSIGERLRRVAQAQAFLWPQQAPQERVVNPLPWLARHGTPLLDAMQQACAEDAATLVHGGD